MTAPDTRKALTESPYVVTLRIFGRGGGEWPYGFDTIEEAAEQAHRWCDEALNADNPEDWQLTFARQSP